jgi:hypothetical protein
MLNVQEQFRRVHIEQLAADRTLGRTSRSPTMRNAIIALLIAISLHNVTAFGPYSKQNITPNSAKKLMNRGYKWATAVLVTSLLTFGSSDMTVAAETKKPLLTYKSGKSPTAANPNNPKEGTKKEPSFLRCVSNCKSDCQKPGEGLAKNDCVSDCQDQCCSSYEQCSFKIKSSAGNSI